MIFILCQNSTKRIKNNCSFSLNADREADLNVLSDDAAAVGGSEWKQPLSHPHGSVNKPTSVFHWPVVSAWDGGCGGGGGYKSDAAT